MEPSQGIVQWGVVGELMISMCGRGTGQSGPMAVTGPRALNDLPPTAQGATFRCLNTVELAGGW